MSHDINSMLNDLWHYHHTKESAKLFYIEQRLDKLNQSYSKDLDFFKNAILVNEPQKVLNQVKNI